MSRPLKARLLLLSALLGTASCEGGNEGNRGVPRLGGSVARGERIVADSGCGACHRVPGLAAARGDLAAPLDRFSRRSFIAGELPNTPDNLVRWLQNPRAIRPRTAMPAVGLTAQQARDVAAYLYTLD